MAAKNIYTGQDARTRLLRGADKAARAIAVTYGPGGRNCVLDRMAGMLVTKDGVTVAREIDLADHVENQGCQILKAACVKVNDDVGDGTTTVAIIAHALLKEGHKLITAAGVSPTHLIYSVSAAAEQALVNLQQMARNIETQEDLERVAFLACNGDQEIATNLAEACMAVGRDGTVIIEDGAGVETTLELKDGMEIDQGPCSPMFLTEKPERVIENPLVAVIHSRLQTLPDVQDILEVASQWPQHELVIFCLVAEGEALATMIVNDSKAVVKCVPIGAPGMQFRKLDYLKDIAALSGATLVDSMAGRDHKTWDAGWFGALRQIVIKPKSTTLICHAEAEEGIQARVAEIKAEEAICSSDYDRDRIRERIAKLSGGMAVLKVGGVTELELKERRARVEDALGSVKAALKAGVVPGGGIAYLRAAPPALDYGSKIFRLAMAKPLEVLAWNAGEEGLVIIDQCQQKDQLWYGWDAVTKQYRDLGCDPPVIDPLLVTMSVVKAAVSVATTLLTVETAIVLK